MQPHGDTVPLLPCSLQLPQDPTPPSPLVCTGRKRLEPLNPAKPEPWQAVPAVPCPAVALALTSPSAGPWPAARGPSAAPAPRAGSGEQHPRHSARQRALPGPVPGTGRCQHAALAHTPTLAALQSATTSTLGTNLGNSSAAAKTRQGRGACHQLGALGSCHPPDKPWGHSGFQPQCWRLSEALRDILGAWMKEGIPKSQHGVWPWSSSTWQGKTDPEIP